MFCFENSVGGYTAVNGEGYMTALLIIIYLSYRRQLSLYESDSRPLVSH